MGNSSKQTQPHFFRPLLPHFLLNFSIPNFFQKHLETSGDRLDDDNNKKIAILRDGRRKCWEVKVENDSRPKFKQGWETFCKDNELQIGDFLVFRHHGNFIFDVFIFGPNACERQLSTTTSFETKCAITRPKIEALHTNNIDQRCNGLIGARDQKLMRNKALFKPSKYPICRMTVRPYWTNGYVYFHRDFSKRIGLADKQSCELTMIDEKDKRWSLTLRQKRDGRVYIIGWRPFYEANALNVGDHVIFQLLHSGQTPLIKFYST